MMNEARFSEWEDFKSKKTIRLTGIDIQAIHHGVSRSLKHITVRGSMAASGQHVISYIITSQESDDLQGELRKKGIECAAEFEIKAENSVTAVLT
jgi:hypothetical protein